MPGDVANLTSRLSSVDPRTRDRAAAEIGERISTSGRHEFSRESFLAVGASLVDSLLVEDDDGAFESELSCLVELAEWELVRTADLDRALAAPGRRRPGLGEHWAYLRECRSLYDAGSET